MDDSVDGGHLHVRLQEHVLAWRITVDDLIHTGTSVLAFGHRGPEPVVLKVVRNPGEEWASGPVLDAFAGRGVVRALEHTDGALLLERLLPGKPLADEKTDDLEATEIIAHVIGRMSPDAPPSTTPTIQSWGRSFERYQESGGAAIPGSLVAAAHRTYMELCDSQGAVRLLHGDLHHHNVLLDSHRGWVAIDPKGVVGELAYEVGAALRNPCGRPELFAEPPPIRRRVDCFARVLQLDTGRILAWAFSQAVLAAIWELEDDGVLSAGTSWIALASSIRSLL